MRVIIAGSREYPGDIWDCHKKIDMVRLSFPISEILSGGAKGPDFWGECYCDCDKNPQIKLRRYPADWSKYGKSAGFRRNEEMAKNADALIAFWDGKSRGTKHMIDIALKQGLWVKVFTKQRDEK